MFGQGCPLVVEPDLPVCEGGAPLLLGVVVEDEPVALAGAALAVDVVDALCVEGAAEALAIPAATPPVASAPATIVAPSIFETFIGFDLLGRMGWCGHGARRR